MSRKGMKRLATAAWRSIAIGFERVLGFGPLVVVGREYGFARVRDERPSGPSSSGRKGNQAPRTGP